MTKNKNNKPEKTVKSINKNKFYLNNENLFIFGIKPTNPSSEYGYFVTKKINKKILLNVLDNKT